MHYVITDAEGASLASTDDFAAACRLLDEFAASDADAGEEFMLLTYNQHGEPVKNARLLQDLPESQ